MKARPGPALGLYLGLTWLAGPFARWHLCRRLARGREEPGRWREKLGYPSLERPPGPLVWLHAVGLGEALALRGLIAALADRNPDWQFLITSGTRQSAGVLSGNLPTRTRHQFAPLDLPGAAARFLDHWRPDMAVWSEQDIWPGLVWRTARRGIPLALVNARMNAAAFRRRRPLRGLYRDVFACFTLISAQDALIARHLKTLGAGDVRSDGSLKSVAPPLAADEAALAQWRAKVDGRRVWVAASTHPEDERLVLRAQARMKAQGARAPLIIAPRFAERGAAVAAAAADHGLSVARRSADADPHPLPEVYVADTVGELGLWYRIARVAYVGGTMSSVEGHNPWEAAVLSTPVLHGPRTGNFASDFADLDAAGAGLVIETAEDLAAALATADLAAMSRAAKAAIADRAARLRPLEAALCDLMPARAGP